MGKVSHIEHSCSCGRDNICFGPRDDGVFEMREFRCSCGMMMFSKDVMCDKAEPLEEEPKKELLSGIFHKMIHPYLVKSANGRAISSRLSAMADEYQKDLKKTMDHGQVLKDKPEVTLAEKFHNKINALIDVSGTKVFKTNPNIISSLFEGMAEEYFKEHPEEIGCIHKDAFIEIHTEGMVSLDKVLDVFDNFNFVPFGFHKEMIVVKEMRKALEGMGESENIKIDGNELGELGNLYRTKYYTLRRAVLYSDLDEVMMVDMCRSLEGKSEEQVKNMFKNAVWNKC